MNLKYDMFIKTKKSAKKNIYYEIVVSVNGNGVFRGFIAEETKNLLALAGVKVFPLDAENQEIETVE